jgi:hypothetical protein
LRRTGACCGTEARALCAFARAGRTIREWLVSKRPFGPEAATCRASAIEASALVWIAAARAGTAAALFEITAALAGNARARDSSAATVEAGWAI